MGTKSATPAVAADTPVTHHVALPFIAGEDGEVVAGEAVEHPTPSSARAAARLLVEKNLGAISFSRTGDPASGDFADAVVLASFRTVLSADERMAAT